MKKPASLYWFPARRFGWGWGLPNCWQGWLVLATYIGAAALGIGGLAPAHPAGFVAYLGVLSALFIGVCIKKGEPLRWRWGSPPKLDS